jgi:hypothetical protein
MVAAHVGALFVNRSSIRPPCPFGWQFGHILSGRGRPTGMVPDNACDADRIVRFGDSLSIMAFRSVLAG